MSISPLTKKIALTLLVSWSALSFVLLLKKSTPHLSAPLQAIDTKQLISNDGIVSATTIPKATEKPDEPLKTILYWHPFFDMTDFYFGLGREAFFQNNCSCNRCVATFNRSYVDMDKFDAIVFHGPTFNIEIDKLPPVRSPHQIYVYVALESPLMYPVPQNYSGIFNVTATYRLDSDIPHPYHAVYDLHTGKYVAPKIQPMWKAPNHDPEYLKQFDHHHKRKSRPIAWFVSNCHNIRDNRIEYVKELQKHIEVDIYGKCGTLQCPHENSTVCKEKLKNDYFFYLAFENSICKDYISERLKFSIANDIIPVTYNGADMKNFAPPFSYINAFEHTPLELAKKLIYIMGNVTEYSKYFWWRKVYQFKYRRPGLCVCDVCEMVNRNNLKPQWYDDMREWYHGTDGNQMCIPQDKLKTHW